MMAMAMKDDGTAGSVIARIIADLDAEHAAHQSSHRHYHGRDDDRAKHAHKMLVDLCQRIYKELTKAGV